MAHPPGSDAGSETHVVEAPPEEMDSDVASEHEDVEEAQDEVEDAQEV